MTEGTFPRRMALATDLSHRCDRALDRALLVARAWQAELTVIHALAPPETMTLFGSLRDLPSWRRPPDPVRKARDRIYRDLVREDPHVHIAVHVETGPPALAAAASAAATVPCSAAGRGRPNSPSFTHSRLLRLCPCSGACAICRPGGGRPTRSARPATASTGIWCARIRTSTSPSMSKPARRPRSSSRQPGNPMPN